MSLYNLLLGGELIYKKWVLAYIHFKFFTFKFYIFYIENWRYKFLLLKFEISFTHKEY